MTDVDVDIAAYSGLGQFGPAYRAMFESDAHALGSVDRVLMGSMARLCAVTASYLYTSHTPTEAGYAPGARPRLERIVRRMVALCSSQEDLVGEVARYCARLAERAPGGDDGPEDLVVGGTEEEIIRRSSDWCTDLARVGCALCQVAGVPARIVYLADTGRAYSGHAIIEAHRDGAWGAVDVTTDLLYRWPESPPATTWDLVSNPWLVARHAQGRAAIYAREGQFRRAGIANYDLAAAADYDYTASRPNGYYRSILAMAAAGWPGGLRWLHGEDRATADEEAAVPQPERTREGL